MAMRIGDIHKLSPSSAGAMFCSPHHRRRPPLLSINTDKRQLCHIWLSPTARQVERHHFLLLAIRCAKITFFCKLFDFFNFSILNLMAGYPSTSAYSFDIGTSIVAHHSLSDAPKHVFTSHFLHRCRYVACHRWIPPSMDGRNSHRTLYTSGCQVSQLGEPRLSKMRGQRARHTTPRLQWNA